MIGSRRSNNFPSQFGPSLTIDFRKRLLAELLDRCVWRGVDVIVLTLDMADGYVDSMINKIIIVSATCKTSGARDLESETFIRVAAQQIANRAE